MQYIPAGKTGGDAFTEALQPYLQMAMQNMLQRKMADRQYQQNLQRAQQLQPELFQQTAQVPTPQGQQQVAYSPAMGKIPTSLRFMQNKAQPGQEFNASTGELSYKSPNPVSPMFGFMGGQSNIPGYSALPQTVEEAKQTIIERGENPADYNYKPVITTGKGGAKAQAGFSPELDPKLQESRIKNEDRGNLIRSSAEDTLGTISEVEKGIENFGLFGQLPSVPGSERATWEANVNKLLSGKIINLMTEMKEASKTGATGFGQLSNKELEVLKESSTALKRGLSPKDAQKVLNDMKTKLKKITNPKSQNDLSTMSDEELRAIAGGK